MNEVILEDLRHTTCQAFSGFDVQELIRSMRIGMRPQQACNEKLGIGKDLTEHAHERNRSTRTHVHRRLAEEGF